MHSRYLTYIHISESSVEKFEKSHQYSDWWRNCVLERLLTQENLSFQPKTLERNFFKKGVRTEASTTVVEKSNFQLSQSCVPLSTRCKSVTLRDEHVWEGSFFPLCRWGFDRRSCLSRSAGRNSRGRWVLGGKSIAEASVQTGEDCTNATLKKNLRRKLEVGLVKFREI